MDGQSSDNHLAGDTNNTSAGRDNLSSSTGSNSLRRLREIELEDVKLKAASLLQYVGIKTNAFFEKNIPIDEIKETENMFWRRTLGLLACSVMLGVFLFFVATSKSSLALQ